MLTLAVRSPAFFPTSLAAWLFENHYALWLALVAAGAVLIFVARSRADTRMLRAGQLTLALTLAWLLMARLFETPSERLYATHVALASAAAKPDLDAMLSFFDKRFTSPALNIGIGDDPAKAKAELESRIKQIGIHDTTFTVYQPTLNDDATASTHIIAITTSEMGPIKTEWSLSWNDLPADDWKLQNASLLRLGDQSVSPTEIVH